MSQCPVGLTRGLTLTVHQEPIHTHKIHKPNCCTGIFGEGEGLLGQTNDFSSAFHDAEHLRSLNHFCKMCLGLKKKKKTSQEILDG